MEEGEDGDRDVERRRTIPTFWLFLLVSLFCCFACYTSLSLLASVEIPPESGNLFYFVCCCFSCLGFCVGDLIGCSSIQPHLIQTTPTKPKQPRHGPSILLFFLLVVFFWISKVASVFCFFPFGVSAAYSFISMSTTYYLPMYPPNKPRKFLTLFITSLDVKNTACDSGRGGGKTMQLGSSPCLSL